MAFDKNTNTISVDENSDFLVDSGLFFINILSQTSQDTKASKELINDWHVIEDWLGCKNGVITSKKEEKKKFESILNKLPKKNQTFKQ